VAWLKLARLIAIESGGQPVIGELAYRSYSSANATFAGMVLPMILQLCGDVAG